MSSPEKPLVPELLLALRTVIDPELGINVVDLGLIRAAERDGARAKIEMTMTTPACPMGPYLTEEVETALTTLAPGIREAEVTLSFEPPWSPAQMSPEGRRALGVDEP